MGCTGMPGTCAPCCAYCNQKQYVVPGAWISIPRHIGRFGGCKKVSWGGCGSLLYLIRISVHGPPACHKMAQPFAQVLISCPPPIPSPTQPNPVKPLCLPTLPSCGPPPISEVQALHMRYDNFYNNYNIDWHADSPCCKPPKMVPVKTGRAGCEDYMARPCCSPCDGCPTGFKTCTMKMTPPPCWDPCGVWCATVMPCPPKPRVKVSYLYKPGPCKRPCCLHWCSREGPCRHGLPCKAHCYNVPIGLKAYIGPI